MFRFVLGFYSIIFHISEVVCLLESPNNEELKKIEFIDESGNVHYIDLTAPVGDVPDLNSTRRYSPENVQFWLYSRDNINNYKELTIPGDKVLSEEKSDIGYNPDRPLFFVTHGWMSNGESESIQLIKKTFLSEQDVNVIVVNWAKDAGSINYVRSASSTILVAQQMRKMILSLADEHGLKGKDIHLIGFSLGAHIVGLTGKILKVKDNFVVGRVTGLDPARPFFEFPKAIPGISNEAAAFVDIIHTNSGALGYINNIGHADFYPNGGIWQPHCCEDRNALSCSHTCACIYFAESISGIQYDSFKCDAYQSYLRGSCYDNERELMGLPATPTADGSYYLNVENPVSKWLQAILTVYDSK